MDKRPEAKIMMGMPGLGLKATLVSLSKVSDPHRFDTWVDFTDWLGFNWEDNPPSDRNADLLPSFGEHGEAELRSLLLNCTNSTIRSYRKGSKVTT